MKKIINLYLEDEFDVVRVAQPRVEQNKIGIDFDVSGQSWQISIIPIWVMGENIIRNELRNIAEKSTIKSLEILKQIL